MIAPRRDERVAEEAQAAGLVEGGKALQEQPPEQAGKHRTGRKKPGRQDTQRWPSGEMPPPGTIMCTCGWWVMARASGVQHGRDADPGS